MPDVIYCDGSLEHVEANFDRQLEDAIDVDTAFRFQLACSFLVACDNILLKSDDKDVNHSADGQAKLDNDNNPKISNEREHKVRYIFAEHTALVQQGDTRLLEELDNLLLKLRSRQSIQLVFDILPRIFSLSLVEENNFNHVINSASISQNSVIEDKFIDLLQRLLDKSSNCLIEPILSCVSSLTLSVDGKIKVVEMIIAVFPRMLCQDVPKAIQHLLRHITDRNDTRSALVAIRNKFKNRKQDTKSDALWILVAAQSLKYFVSAVASPILRSFLAPAYIAILENETKKSHITTYNQYLTIDVIFLSMIKTDLEYKRLVDKLLLTWLSSKRIPFDNLEKVIEATFSSELSSGSNMLMHSNMFAQNLIQLTLFLYLSPLNVNSCVSSMDLIESFAYKLYCSLTHHDCGSFINSLFFVLKSTMMVMGKQNNHLKKRSDSDANDLHSATIQSILKTIRNISLLEPHIITPLKTAIMSLLDNPFGDDIGLSPWQYPEDDIGEVLSDLLVIILEAENNGHGHCDLIDETKSGYKSLVSRMLSSSKLIESGECSPSSSHTWGLILASKLYQSDAISTFDKGAIQRLIIRLALSETKLLVDPQVGILVLEFLLLPKKDGNVNETFNYVKHLLSRTGLIQKKHNGEIDSTTLCASNEPSSSDKISSPDDRPTENYNFIFCVDFYSKNNADFAYASASLQTADWIFRLTDTYLRLGQAQSSWKPDRWLTASFRYPSLTLPTPRSRKMQNALSVLKTTVCDNQLDLLQARKEDIEEAAEILSCLEFEEVRALKTAIICYFKSLLIAGALSAAIIRNIFTQINPTMNKNLKVSFEQIKWRLDDFYRIKNNCEVLFYFLSSLSRMLLRRRRTSKRVNDEFSNSNGLNQSVLEGTSKKIPMVVRYKLYARII
jgi:hypothetical protein